MSFPSRLDEAIPSADIRHVSGGGSASKAAQAASSIISILDIPDDMVGSLANRGGNTTWISLLTAELDGKPPYV